MTAEAEPRRLSDRERVNLLLDEVARLKRQVLVLESQNVLLTRAGFESVADHSL